MCKGSEVAGVKDDWRKLIKAREAAGQREGEETKRRADVDPGTGQRIQARVGLCPIEVPSKFVIPAEAGLWCDLGHLASSWGPQFPHP